MSLLAALQGAGAVMGLAESGFNIFQGQQNYQLQKNAYEANQQNIEITRQREDTATQRRVADLKAAGLSPVLAAGSPAQSAMAPNVPAPQMSISPQSDKAFKNAEIAGALMQQKQQIAQTQADIERTRAETEKSKVETSIASSNLGMKPIEMKLLEANVSAKELENAIKNYDFAYFRNLGIPTSTRGDLLQIAGAISALGTKLGEKPVETLGKKLFDFVVTEPFNDFKSGMSPLITGTKDYALKQQDMQSKLDEGFEKKLPKSWMNWYNNGGVGRLFGTPGEFKIPNSDSKKYY